MALVVENGNIVANADSYASVASIDAYWVATGGPLADQWSGYSSADKETAARRACRQLDASYRRLWIGRRTSPSQELEWPRFGAVTMDSFLLPSSGSGAIPKELIWAQAELAVRAGAGDLQTDLTDERTVKSESVGVDVISISASYESGTSQQQSFTKYRVVDDYLGRLLIATGPGTVVLGVERA